jgi:ribosomal protein S18 acetylase RimI-like enzyme
MNIINATWEKRNFGCPVFEVEFNQKDFDSFDTHIKGLKEIENQKAYIVLKCPVGNVEIIHKLEDYGFRFLETIFDLKKKTNTSFSLPEYYNRLNCLFKTREILDKTEWKEIIKNNITDKMFVSDRVYLDPILANAISAKRYKNWANDLSDDSDARMLLIEKKSNKEPIGFTIVKENKDSNSTNGLIGGIFPNISCFGVGAMLISAPLEYAFKRNSNYFMAHISSNNLPVLKLYSQFGFEFISEHYVLRKYIKE